MSDLVRVAGIDEVPLGRVKLVEVNGNEIAVFNLAGSFHAVDNSCTHVGGPLCEGEISGSEVICPWHGATFDITTGQAVGPPASDALKRYNVTVAGSDILIELS